MVVYTPAVRKATVDIESLIQMAIDTSNISFQHSKITASFNLAGSYEVQYTESNIDTDLQKLQAMDDVKKLRAQYGADVVVMLVTSSDACGEAAAIGANASNAFAVVNYSPCAVPNYSFPHEIGHLLNARHDETNDSTPGYNHGYNEYSHLPQTTPNFYTVMSYQNSCPCSRIQWWSNPNVNYSGTSTGTTSTNDNARMLNQTVPVVAAFASIQGPFQTRIFERATTFVNESDGVWLMADYDKDGIPDLIFTKTSNTPNNHVEVHVASGK
jgi:hypothetical protein